MSFHRWISTDTEEYDSCLTCGGMWVNGESGRHYAFNGESAVPCTGDTSQVHGFSGEQWCDVCDKGNDEGCAHVHAECNCLFCDS